MDKISLIGPINPIAAQSVLNAPGVAVKPASEHNGDTVAKQTPNQVEVRE